MQVNEILKLSAIFTGEEDVAKSNILNPAVATMEPEDENLSQQPVLDQQEIIDKAYTFLMCLNMVLEDIAKDYLPLLQEEEIVFTEKKFEYENLSKVISDIVKLQNPAGLAIKFKCFPEYIKADIHKAIITYSYLPEEVSLNQSFEFFDNKLTERIIAYGVAMEYMFLNSLSDEAAVWENRFLNSLESAIRKKHNVSLPKRRWL